MMIEAAPDAVPNLTFPFTLLFHSLFIYLPLHFNHIWEWFGAVAISTYPTLRIAACRPFQRWDKVMMEAAPGTVLDLIFPFTFFSFHFQHYFHTILICIRIYRPQASYPETFTLPLIHFLHSPIIPLFKLMEELFRPDYNWTWFISVSVKSVIGIKILPGSPCLFGFGVKFFLPLWFIC